MATFGETLKRERELRKISLREVSEATKIGLRYLEAMEANQFEQLPGGLFNKGFIRAYAKFIGLDGEALVDSYLYDIAHLPGLAAARPRAAGMTAEDPPPIDAQGSLPSAARRLLPTGRLAAGAAALVVLAAGVWFVLTRAPGEARGGSGEPPPEPMQEAGLIRPSEVSEANAVEPGTLPAREADPAVEQPASPGMEVPNPVVEAEPKRLEAPPRPAKSRELSLFIGTTETTQIAVYCAGVERLRRELMPGETVAISCPTEALLSASNAGALSLKINGKDCMPLGERGAILVDFPLSRERAAEICSDGQEPS